MSFEPKDINYAAKVRASFARQPVMAMIGADLLKVEPGAVDIKLGYRTDLSQQNGFLHAGMTATIGDSACGYAAFSLMPAGADVLTAEYKINLLSPAVGEYFVAEGRVLKAGRTLSVVRADVFAVVEDGRKLVATMLASVVAVPQKN
jgi:uncharacterized protein (TIGR00369 family)